MKAGTVFNIAIHLSEPELEKLHSMISEKVLKKSTPKKHKKILITESEAREFILKRVFRKKKHL